MTEIELPDDIYERISDLGEAGNEAAEADDLEGAIASYRQAWDLLPEPKQQWQAATWILGAIGDFQFALGDYAAARDTLTQAMECAEAVGNPFLHLRLGQAHFETGNMERASDELARAFLIEGTVIFDDEDPKYLALIKDKLKAPPGGWPEGWTLPS